MELWLDSNSDGSKFIKFLYLVGFEFEKVERLSLESRVSDDLLNLFFLRANNVKELLLTNFGDSDLEKVADKFLGLKKLIFNASEVSVRTLDYLLSKCEIEFLGLNFPSMGHLRYLVANSKVHKLKALYYCSSLSGSSEEAGEEEELLCRFVRSCGENLEELSLYTFANIEKICNTIAENCPKFESLSLEIFQDNQFFTLKMLEMIAEKCPKFPRKLVIDSNADLVCTHEEAINFMEKFYWRVEELSLCCQEETRFIETLMDTAYLDPQKVRKIEFGFLDIPLKPFFESILQMEKLSELKVVCVQYDKEIKEKLELRSTSLQKLNFAISSKTGCVRVICDNLTRFNTGNDITVETKRTLESMHTVEDPFNVLSHLKVHEFSISQSLDFVQFQK